MTRARTLVAHIRECGPHTEAEWREYADVLEELLRVLAKEPLTFECAFTSALMEVSDWTPEEAWTLAKEASTVIPSGEMREALEWEWSDAWHHIGDCQRAALRRPSTEAERRELAEALR